jgi:hypothetical protein
MRAFSSGRFERAQAIINGSGKERLVIALKRYTRLADAPLTRPTN